MKRFLELFCKKVLIDRNAYLKTELIKDIHEVSLENRCCHKKYSSLKKRLVEEFGNSIEFYIAGEKTDRLLQ